MKSSLEQVIDRLEEVREEECWRRKDFEDYSKFYASESNLSWIWRKGVNLGKKMVFTGVVVSSAPFVLPPLVALSAIGFALSLPAGFVFATYACTDKLMNTLLPMSSESDYPDSGVMSNDEEEYRVDDNEVEKGYEEEDDISVEETESEDDARKEIENTVRLGEGDARGVGADHYVMGIPKDEQVTSMRVPEIVEEGGYAEDVGNYMDAENQVLDSNAIPDIMKGIREAEDEISVLEKQGVEMPKDSLSEFVVQAEVDGRNDTNVEQVIEELAFVPSRDVMSENRNDGVLADIDEHELRNETTEILERIRDEGRDDCGQLDNLNKGKCKENEENTGISINDISQERRENNLFIIPEEVKPAGIVGSEDSNETVDERSVKWNETEIAEEQPELVIERMLVDNVKTSGDHTTTEVHRGTGLDEKKGTLIFSEVDVVEVVDGSRSDKVTEVPEKLADLLSEGENLASGIPIDVGIDYHESRIESIPISKLAGAGLDQESIGDSDKESVNEEKIWEQIRGIRTIIGCKTAPHESCVDELKALYEFTGVELPALSKDVDDIADVNEKLHFLMSIVGVK